jgi:hypothetical protein
MSPFRKAATPERKPDPFEALQAEVDRNAKTQNSALWGDQKNIWHRGFNEKQGQSPTVYAFLLWTLLNGAGLLLVRHFVGKGSAWEFASSAVTVFLCVAFFKRIRDRKFLKLANSVTAQLETDLTSAAQRGVRVATKSDLFESEACPETKANKAKA